MSSRFDGMNGQTLLQEARRGVPEADKPGFRAALESRAEALRSVWPETGPEVATVKAAVDLVFPGEPVHWAQQGA